MTLNISFQIWVDFGPNELQGASFFQIQKLEFIKVEIFISSTKPVVEVSFQLCYILYHTELNINSTGFSKTHTWTIFWIWMFFHEHPD